MAHSLVRPPSPPPRGSNNFTLKKKNVFALGGPKVNINRHLVPLNRCEVLDISYSLPLLKDIIRPRKCQIFSMVSRQDIKGLYMSCDLYHKLLFFGHFSFNRNNIQTAVTNMTKQRM